MKRRFLSILLIGLLGAYASPVVAQSDLTITLEVVLGKGIATSSAWSPDGDLIAVGSSTSLWLYTATLEEVKQVAAEPVTQLLWNPQGTLLVSENERGVDLWDIEDNAKLVQLPGYSFPAAWNAEGTTLALTVPSQNRVVLWDVAPQRARLAMTVKPQNGISTIRFLGWNAEQVIGIASDYDPSTLSDHYMFFVWNGRTGELLSAIQPDSTGFSAPTAQLISSGPSTSEILAVSRDSFLRFDVRDEQPLKIVKNDGVDPIDLAISPDGERLATVSWGTCQTSLCAIQVWNAETLTLFDTIGTSPGVFESAAHVTWSPDSQYLLTDAPGMIRIWDIETGQVLHQRTDYMTRVNGLAWNPNGELLALANGSDDWYAGDFRVRLWDVEPHAVPTVCEGASGPVEAVDWNPEGTRLATAGGTRTFLDDKLRIWNPASCTVEASATVGTSLGVLSSAWSPDGQFIAAQLGGGVEVWEVAKLSEGPRMLPVGLGEAVVWHPTQPWLVVEQLDAIGIYDISDAEAYTPGEPLPHAEPVISLPSHIRVLRTSAWDPGGTQLALGGGEHAADDLAVSQNYTIEIWDIGRAALAQTLTGHEDTITSLAWSPTGRLLASAGADKVTRIWDVTTGEQVAVLEGHTDIVSTVAWNADGTLLASGGYDGLVYIWRVAD